MSGPDEGIGRPIPRKEDRRLLTGRGRYSDDVNLERQAYAAMVRSPHGHARIRAISNEAAQAVPGVLAVLTGADVAADGLNPVPHSIRYGPRDTPGPDVDLVNRDGRDPYITPHYPLPRDKARFVGEAVAMVVAETAAAAREGADRVEVAYEPLPAVTLAAEAVKERAPLIWEEAGTNACIDADVGDSAAVDAVFATAAHRVHIDTLIQRVTGVPMEPRAAVGAYDAGTGRYTLHAGSGNVVRQKRELAAVLGVDREDVRVVARDIGGNFGTRNAFYPEFALVAWAARRLGRPVKWTCTRSESFLSDYQGRDLTVSADLALDADGRFLAFRSSNISNIGAHTVSFTALNKGAELMSSVYHIPIAYVRARAAMTNTVPTNSYRSAGRPEVMYVIERLIELAARQCGFDAMELRRRNLVAPAAQPYTNAHGLTYDSGDYAQPMETALRLADWEGFEARRTRSLEKHRLRGIGVANYIECTGGVPRERTEITVRPDGEVDVVIGTLSSGQGHETSFAQLLAEWFSVPLDRVNLITGDTDIVEFGGGSHSARSMRLAGIVMGRASEEILARARRIASRVFGVPADEIRFADGAFRAGDRRLDLFEVAKAALTRNDLEDGLRGPLTAICDETVTTGGFPFGCHVCEVEVDPETCAVEIVGYTAVDDVGRAVNPLILHGQTHGGAAQGVGQAASEACVYDPTTGQLLSGSFMDYAMPRAHTMPSFRAELAETPAPGNPLGIRAGGEGGTTPALGVYVNAVVNALAHLGVSHIEMPLSPERVWRAVNAAKAAGKAERGA